MIKALYVDCTFGISGDMFVASLLHASRPESLDVFEKYAGRIADEFGFSSSVREVRKNGICGYRLEVQESPENFKNFEEFQRAIKRLKLPQSIEEMSVEVVRSLTLAEAAVHGEDFLKSHFHELGSVDTLFDAVLSSALVVELGFERFYSSPVAVGSGKAEIDHGLVSVPAPATVELLKGMPLQGRELVGEVTTPTGAAILRTLKPEFYMPDGFYLESAGYGFGTKEFGHPNYLRILTGWVKEEELYPVYEVRTNIDDTSPQVLGALVPALLEKGALDAWIEQVVMKKGRPGFILSFLASEDNLGELIEMVFKETSTLGIRFSKTYRAKIQRSVESVATEYGEVKVKVASNGKIIKVSAEFDDCLEIAKAYGVSAQEVKRRAEEGYLKNLRNSASISNEENEL